MLLKATWTAAAHVGKSVEQVEAAALDRQERHGEKSRQGKADRDGGGDCGIGPQIEQPGESERGIGKLPEELEGDVDNRARRGRRPGDARQGDGARSQYVAADLRKRQQFGSGVADEASPNRDPKARKSVV